MTPGHTCIAVLARDAAMFIDWCISERFPLVSRHQLIAKRKGVHYLFVNSAERVHGIEFETIIVLDGFWLRLDAHSIYNAVRQQLRPKRKSPMSHFERSSTEEKISILKRNVATMSHLTVPTERLEWLIKTVESQVAEEKRVAEDFRTLHSRIKTAKDLEEELRHANRTLMCEIEMKNEEITRLKSNAQFTYNADADCTAREIVDEFRFAGSSWDWPALAARIAKALRFKPTKPVDEQHDGADFSNVCGKPVRVSAQPVTAAPEERYCIIGTEAYHRVFCPTIESAIEHAKPMMAKVSSPSKLLIVKVEGVVEHATPPLKMRPLQPNELPPARA